MAETERRATTQALEARTRDDTHQPDRRHGRCGPARDHVHRRHGARVEPSRGAPHRPRPVRGHHRPVCVRQPGRAGHDDHHRQLHRLPGAVRRTELLRLRPDRPVLDQGRQHRRRRRGRDLHVPASRATSPTPTASCTAATDPSPRTSPANVTQTLEVTRNGESLGSGLAVPPPNIGPRTTPKYGTLAATGINALSGDAGKVFAGQRDDPFFADLGAIFDLGGLRPFNAAHLIPLKTAKGQDDLAGYNVNSIAIQVPKSQLTNDGQGRHRRRCHQRGHRCVGRRFAPEHVRHGRGPGRLGPGLTTRQPAHQRGHHPARPEGRLERRQPRGRCPVRRSLPLARAGRDHQHRLPLPAGYHGPRIAPTWCSSLARACPA